jgi:hypothetical protein
VHKIGNVFGVILVKLTKIKEWQIHVEGSNSSQSNYSKTTQWMNSLEVPDLSQFSAIT